VGSDPADLDHLSRSRLRDLWEKEVGEKPPESFGGHLTRICFLSSPSAVYARIYEFAMDSLLMHCKRFICM
jgi:hypothetical protein